MEDITKPLNVLIVEDSEDDYLLIERELKRGGYDITSLRVETSAGMTDALQKQEWDVILADYALPNYSANEALDFAQVKCPDIPFIIVSGTIGEDTAVAAMKAGATDYILKDNLKRLCPAVDRGLREVAERRRRREAENALQVSEARHRTLFETMAQGVVYQDSEGHIISANLAAERILGLTLDQMQGRTSIDPRWKAIHEDSSDFPGDTHPAMVALRTGKQVKNVVMGVFHPGKNSHVWININAIPQFKPEETKPYQVYTTFEDMTERKQAEEELRKSEERYRTLFKQSMDAVYITSREGRFLDANQSTLDLLGYTLEEILEIPVADTYADPSDRAGFQKVIEQHGFVKDYEVKFCTKNGRLIDCLLTSTVRRGEDGSILGYHGLIRDVTERKKMENEIRQSEERYRILMQRLNEGVYQLDLEGNYVALNDSGARIFGFDSPEEIIGRASPSL